MAGKLSTAVALALVGSQCAQQASAHGKLTVPKSRNELGGSSTCAHCLNGGGPCGDSSSLNFYAGPQATWTAGSIVPITVKVTAHHMGHYEFRVCDQLLDASTPDPDACLNKWVLERATPAEAAAAFGLSACSSGDTRPFCTPFDEQHPERWYLPPRGEVDGTHTVYFKVPAGLQCEACTLQWHWWTANSCQPAGDYGCYKESLQASGYWVGSKAAWWTAFSGSCSGPAGPNGQKDCGEQFWNCADIVVQPADGSSVPAPAPVPSPATTTLRPTASPTTTPPATPATPAPTATPEPEPEPEPEMPAAGGACAGEPCANPAYCRSKWGSCGTGSPWCNAESTWKAGGCGGTPAPPAGCTGAPCANPAHCRSRWGSCGSGSPWCNDESTWKAGGCAPSLLATKKRGVRLHRFLGV